MIYKLESKPDCFKDLGKSYNHFFKSAEGNKDAIPHAHVALKFEDGDALEGSKRKQGDEVCIVHIRFERWQRGMGAFDHDWRKLKGLIRRHGAKL